MASDLEFLPQFCFYFTLRPLKDLRTQVHRYDPLMTRGRDIWSLHIWCRPNVFKRRPRKEKFGRKKENEGKNDKKKRGV